MIIHRDIYLFSIFSSKVLAGFSTRTIGSIKIKRKLNTRSLKNLALNFEINPDSIFRMDQRHTGNVAIVGKNSPKESRETDGLITKEKNQFLMVVTADCVPIIFADEKRELISVIHAGYKGILSGIIENTITLFLKQGSDMENVKVGIGPSIGVCCYNVSGQRIGHFKKKYPEFKNFFEKRSNEYFLNLHSVVFTVLKTHGIGLENIEYVNLCTSCNVDMFFSYRRDIAKSFGEFATIVGML